MAHFYKRLLDESEQQHEEAVAATVHKANTVKGPQGPMPNLTIVKPPDFTPKSDAEIARAAREQGKDVELNDDNQIVDKRELLSAGLNLSAPNTRRLGLKTATKDGDAKPVEVHRAVGTAASRQEINERRLREISTQMEEEQSRQAKERQERQREAEARFVARRNDDAAVQTALERYQERKRRKLDAAGEQKT
ncbi:hypothetical protein FA95DRAFT_1551914 [Auriscalpium vulgare]|uniref:Uncharacterized protein n=1 Tax=Auriscalpium vulgare TaxID=40419 RepID=A0ACB8SD23_9AGAM|nr:hypothetical protein FA95DRAFT_1551914 [Auriscalpium vulgare]